MDDFIAVQEPGKHVFLCTKRKLAQILNYPPEVGYERSLDN